jgi:methyl-accepting chemotaxis protein
MLVFVSIGVTYYFANRYGLSLGIVDRNWLDRDEWLGVIRGRGVLFEVLPLVGLVAVSSMLSYLVITSAVRKYKKFLDSGLDYKYLLTTLKDIDDLEDKSKIERLKNHPELKRVLLSVADALEERERLLSEREGALETRLNDALAAKEREMADDFASQCERLTHALEDRSLDPSAIEFSHKSLKILSDAIQKSRGLPGGALVPDESYGDLRKTSSLFQSKLREIAQELKVSRDGAQDIEKQVRQLVQSGLRPGKAATQATDNESVQSILGSLKSLEDIGASIDVLSEEAKGVAISSALHAGSGTGTQDDLVRLAEDVKEVAARFKDAARRFTQVSDEIRMAAGELESHAEKVVRPGKSAARGERNLDSILSRVTLWVERIVVLSDKLSNLRESYELAMGSLPGAPSEHAGEAPSEEPIPTRKPSPAAEESEEFEFENLERRRTVFADGEPVEVEAPPEETRAEETVPEETPSEEPEPEEVAAAPEAGHEGDRTTFEEMGTGSFKGTSDVDIIDREMSARPGGGAHGEVLGAGAFSRKGARRPEGATEETPRSRRFESDGVEEIDLSSASVGARGRRKKDSRAPKARDEDHDEKALDLYALGAVDYDPALHG